MVLNKVETFLMAVMKRKNGEIVRFVILLVRVALVNCAASRRLPAIFVYFVGRFASLSQSS